MRLLKISLSTALITTWALWTIGGCIEQNTLAHTAHRPLKQGECAPIGYAFEHTNDIPTNEIKRCN